ncbi:ulp1 protease family [Trichoderma arundinaceum]|uniref:Ulp1 protease family n=1 Tax=Trichoderma arundinaceum TaxID=490622 RepID=A0A395NA20_TRIAR|nr:ulp1 protease family [Trichoderma arundinaceum]
MPFRQRMARHFGDSIESAPANVIDRQLSPEKPYLSYYDVLLTIEDIKSLKNDWLTDNNIAFWEEYLEHETLPRFPQARIILLRPSMTFLLMKEPDMRHVRSALPDFSKVTHVFLPINDNRNVAMAEGGSHWSLLLVSVLDGIAFHYDSLGGANYAEANLATRKLSEIVQRPIRFVNLEDSPQQENGSDCGVFVCLLMRHLLVKRLLAANAREKVSMSMAGKMVDSNGGRKEMLRIIENLRKEGERRRSGSRRTARFGSWEDFEKLLHQSQQQAKGSKQPPPKPRQGEANKLAVLPDDPKADSPTANAPETAAQPAQSATRAKTAGKGQLETSTTAKRPVKSVKYPQSKSPPSSQSTPSPIRRMRRIIQPPRDPNKPTMLELKFAPNKGLKKRPGSNSQRPVLSTKPANAMPIKDRGLRAALE